MENFTKIIGFIIALAATSAQAIPTLYFDGTINYAANTTELSVSAALTETTDITPAPVLDGSTMVFSALFDYVESISGGCMFCGTSIKGHFNGDADIAVNDLEIIGGDGTVLLTAKFDSLTLEGAVNGDRGEIIGLLDATGGSLMSMFDGSDLFALQLNLNTVFTTAMYDTDFNGNVDGNITGANSVPEPSILALLGLGFLLAGFARKPKI